MYNQGVIYNQHSFWGLFWGISMHQLASLAEKKTGQRRKRKKEVKDRRWCSPQRRIHPPPWGAGGFLTWNGLLSGRREQNQWGLHSQAEAGASTQRVFDQHVWASLQKMDAGTEGEAGVWAESLVADGLTVLLLFWSWIQTERDNI